MDSMQEFAGLICAGIFLMVAFFIGYGIGNALRGSPTHGVESRPSPPPPQPPTPPPIVLRPVGLGPLWQNSRLYEETRLRGQTIAPQGFIQIGALPEIQPSRTASSEEMISDSEEEYPRHFAGGREYRS